MPDIPESALQQLIDMAKDASKQAYCPYSKFRVGAAVLTNTGDIFSGCNVENASYGLTVCAERNAIFQMVAHARYQIQAIVIYTPTADPTEPCGACRQVINEFGNNARVVSVCDGPERIDTSLSLLLPQAFGRKNLE